MNQSASNLKTLIEGIGYFGGRMTIKLYINNYVNTVLRIQTRAERDSTVVKVCACIKPNLSNSSYYTWSLKHKVSRKLWTISSKFFSNCKKNCKWVYQEDGLRVLGNLESWFLRTMILISTVELKLSWNIECWDLELC